MSARVAALYVAPKGPYPGMPGVDPWTAERDGRLYAGPSPVVAHPPCGHWGRFAWNCKQPESWRECGPVAVDQVRRFGGVLEHPAGSRLWRSCGMPAPGAPPDVWGGYTVEVQQVWWGHEARKLTWLYIVGAPLDAVDELLAQGDRSLVPTRVMGVPRSKGRTLLCLPKSRRHLTPRPFADLLVAIARLAGGTP